MAPKTSVRDARYGKSGGNSDFLKKLKKSHELGRANSAMEQMRAINKHRARISTGMKKSFGEDKEGRMTNWMDDDVREAVIDALIETELLEKSGASWYKKNQPKGRIAKAAGAAAGYVKDKAGKAGSAIASTSGRAKDRVMSNPRVKKGRARGRLARMKTKSAIKGSPGYAWGGVKDVAGGARDLAKTRGMSPTRGRSGQRAAALRRMRGGAGGAALAAGATAATAAGAYGAYRGGKALYRKYKNRKNREESYDARENYHALMESLIGE
jgi:hypothetical protein